VGGPAGDLIRQVERKLPTVRAFVISHRAPTEQGLSASLPLTCVVLGMFVFSRISLRRSWRFSMLRSAKPGAT